MNFIFLNINQWDDADGAYLPTQLSRALAQRGHSILFIQPRAGAYENRAQLPIEWLALTALGMTPLQVDCASYGFDIGELASVGASLRARLEQFHAPGIAVWTAPFEPLARLLPILRAYGWRTVYYPQDDMTGVIAEGYSCFSQAAETYLVENTDVRMSVSPPIVKRLRAAYNVPVHLLPNGFQAAEFSPDVQAIPLPRGEYTLGFWGTLEPAMLDLDALEYVAAQRPHWLIHLLGRVPTGSDAAFIEPLRAYANVRLHAAVPHNELAKYARAFDVCLLPAPANDFSRGRDPLKVYEYLAAHKPVVTLRLPQLAEIPYVYNANTLPEFLAHIETAVQTPLEPSVIDSYLQERTWTARAQTFLQLVEPSRAETPPPAEADRAAPLPSLKRADTIQPAQWQPLYRRLMEYERQFYATQNWARELEAAQTSKPVGAMRRLYRALRRLE